MVPIAVATCCVHTCLIAPCLLTTHPRNLIASKEFFWFGSEAVEPKALAHYLKVEKSAETAHSNIAWASETGKGLLFVGDKTTPSSVISLVSWDPLPRNPNAPTAGMSQ